MNDTEIMINNKVKTSWFMSQVKKKVLAEFHKISGAQLTLTDGHEVHVFGGDGLMAEIVVNDPAFYLDIAMHGSVGAAESYALGRWDSSSLTDVIRMFVVNRALTDGMEGGAAWFKNQFLKLGHFFNKNSLSGSKKNIANHYDLGNDLFKLFLDNNMMYSSAVFCSKEESLEQASVRKLKIICEKLDLKSTDKVIEIGTGWGGFAIYAAQYYGCHVTTTTISDEQHAYVKARIDQLGLSSQITLLKQDYRALEGRFDKLVSIEMIEAVGHQFLDCYTKKINALLKPDGLALIQAITIEDSRYHQALKSVDFIKKHIFPGSFIPCVSAIVSSFAQTADLKLVNLEDFGESYATTLHHWSARFKNQKEKITALGYDEYFQRMWLFYFAYCEGGFLERAISDVHVLMAGPKNRRAPILAIQ
ncbi:SAM-dependent methyltransferase [Marinicella rhabdoformis]|uniref:SAM-dependent methyltransferase n=1 Tax=Marinicella rhabdoformis TaxID=2580566 RepID=UPI001FE6C068|nr:cyclopropane-fatty-acyl-phospholipid synthase family protein [Marinicella rhabdoformis]